MNEVQFMFKEGDQVERTFIHPYWTRIMFEEPPAGTIGTIVKTYYAPGAPEGCRIQYLVDDISGYTYKERVWLLERELRLIKE